MDQELETGKLITSLLDENAQHVDMRTASRLEKARLQAVELYTKRQSSVMNDAVGQLVMGYLHQHKTLVSSAIVIVLAGVLFVAMQRPTVPEAHSDAFLLGSELPPEAYIDKGFDSWLEAS